MAYWSPENATNAFISTLKMESKEKEPNTGEFISALAAGNNAQVMVAACGHHQQIQTTNLLALVAAAHQTGGHVICIVHEQEQIISAKQALKNDAKYVKFVIGNANNLLLGEYKEADFLLVDCNLEKYEEMMMEIQGRSRKEKKRMMVVGYNALLFSKGRSSCKNKSLSCQWSGYRTHLLPIGNGLFVTRIDEKDYCRVVRKSNWIVTVDKCTGEEHVFRVRSPRTKLQVSV